MTSEAIEYNTSYDAQNNEEKKKDAEIEGNNEKDANNETPNVNTKDY